MAKSSRSSVRKANNQRLKRNVFGPVEAARNERLSAKLVELASQPKPEQPEASSEMKVVDDAEEEDEEAAGASTAKEGDETAMDVDAAKPAAVLSKRASKNRIMKRKKSNKVVFPMFKDKKSSKRKH
ncbi:hypothetical protein SLS62_007096 [Diatrype stigma]|uniref:DUF2423 domain-containing protein n=1 Tax=Diatrype stigma TaxID=117547 RepID=A0AAN9YMF5_9PEZI